ncbi:hypothetical protein [Streptomyces syringium]|uniref:hypothetical protein n=1 Tax=Streptomyces syringium TaxID=76729 RepID=UPI003454B4AD
MNFPWPEMASTSAAALSAVAAVGAWVAARRANATANVVASIERERWHADLTPQFSITIERAEGDRSTLDVQLIGPLPLGHLDEVNIAIVSSDDADRTSTLPGPPTQEDIDAQVWGPYRFTHGADGADAHGSRVQAVSMQVGRGRPFSIEMTRAPLWQEGGDAQERWRSRWRGTPLCLLITCRRGGSDQWVIPCEVENPAPRVSRL